jgi:hypothetical protein
MDIPRRALGRGVAKNVMELTRANMVMKPYASSVNPLPRVYNPGMLTKTETKSTIHQTIVRKSVNRPVLVNCGGRTYVAHGADDDEVVWRRLDFWFDILAEQTSPFGDDLVMIVSWQRTVMTLLSVVLIVVLVPEPRHGNGDTFGSSRIFIRGCRLLIDDASASQSEDNRVQPISARDERANARASSNPSKHSPSSTAVLDHHSP